MNAPRIAVVMPRRMHFGPSRAGSIDLCVRDFVRFSRFRDTTTVVAEAVSDPYDDVDVVMHPPGDRRAQFAAVRRLAPDLIVAQQVLPMAAALAAAFPETPVIAHRHNATRPGAGPFWRWRHARRLSRIARLVYVSDHCADSFRALWPRFADRAARVHNGLDMAAWRPAPAEARAPVIAFAGRATGNKGVLELAAALALTLPEAGPEWRARLLLSRADREPDYAARVEAALAPVRDRVDVARDRPFEEVVALFSSAAVAVMPTKDAEPFGRSALEAMAGGAALVSAPFGGLAEVIGDAALRIDPVTPGEIAEALRRLTVDSALRTRLGASARDRAESRFDIRRVAAEMDEIYADALRSGPPGKGGRLLTV